jgi:hypothetical protein
LLALGSAGLELNGVTLVLLSRYTLLGKNCLTAICIKKKTS